MLKLTLKYISLFALVWAFAASSLGCRKDVVEFNPYPNTLSELSLFLKQVPDPATATTFEFNGLNEDKILTTASGARIFLTDVDHLFSSAASPAVAVAASTCTELKIVVTIVKSKGDILSRELPTTTPDDILLESGGMVRVQAFCGTTELQLLTGSTIKIQLPANDAEEDMFVHILGTSNQGFSGWKPTSQQVFKADWPSSNGPGVVKGYELIISQLGWSNCAKPLSQSDVTPFCVSLQPSYTGLNTQAYLVFDNVLAVAPLKFDDTSHSFCFPSIPAGYPVHVVTVTKLAADYWLGKTTTETGTNSMLPVQPQQQEASEILGYLRGL